MQVFYGTAEELPPGLYSDVGRYRYEVFIERLGWELHAPLGSEQDQFDRSDTVYVVARSDDDRVLGCARLLPTTRPYLLSEVFPQLLNGVEPPCSPDVWELSRFSASGLGASEQPTVRRTSPDIAIQLLTEAISCASALGAKHLITVSPIGIERLLRRAGFRFHRAGPPTVIDGHPLFACWIEVQSKLDSPHKDSTITMERTTYVQA